MNVLNFVFDFRNMTPPSGTSDQEQFLKEVEEAVRKLAERRGIGMMMETDASFTALPARNNALTEFPSPVPESFTATP